MGEARVPKRIAAVIINSLKGGVVPRIGLPYITVGREREIKARERKLEDFGTRLEEKAEKATAREQELIVQEKELARRERQLEESEAYLHSRIEEQEHKLVEIAGLIVSVDRMERGTGKLSAIQQIQEDFGIPTYPIVTVRDVIQTLYNKEVDGTVVVNDEMKAKMEAYLEQYGPKV